MVKYLHILILFAIFAAGIVGGHDPMTRAKLAPPFPFYTGQDIERASKMTKKKEFSVLIGQFRGVHGNRYWYESVKEEDYKNNKSHIAVTCPIHGEFPISVGNHLRGQGCPECAKTQRRISNTGNVRKRTKLVYGVGINDYEGNTKYGHIPIPSYHTWVGMLKRCYSEDFKNSHSTYKDCVCDEEWKHFSNFKIWFDDPLNGYKEGYCLDKDILIKGNKTYSPQTCCFVPDEINSLLIKSDKKRGNTPVGVYERKMVNGYKYVAYLSNNVKGHFHLGTFDTPEQAFSAYKIAKEKHIQEVATKCFNEGKITEKVYNALMNYRVEITD